MTMQNWQLLVLTDVLCVLSTVFASVADAQDCEPGPTLTLSQLPEPATTTTSEAVKDAVDEPELLHLEDRDYKAADRSYVVAGHAYTPVTLRDSGDLDLMLVGEAVGVPLMRGDFSGGFDPFGRPPELIRLTAYDLVDGGDPELIAQYLFSTEGHCRDYGDVEGDQDCEVEGPTLTALVVFDTSLNRLAFAEYNAESHFDDEKFECHGVATFQDVNCDGRLELVVTSDCDGSQYDDQLPKRLEVPIAPSQPAPAPPPLATDAIHDDRPFLVIAGSWSETAPNARRNGELRAGELREAGLAEAAVYNSRQFEELEWGYVSVIAARTTTKEEADAVSEQVADAYIKQGFFVTAPLPEPGDCVSQVLARPRGYRLRLLESANEVRAELFNANGKRKSDLTLLTFEPSAHVSAQLWPVPDAQGKPIALVASLDLTTARAVLVVSADKKTPTLLYAGFVVREAKVSVVGDTVSVSAGDATRELVVSSKKGEVVVSVSREVGGLRVEPVGTLGVTPAELD